MKASRVVLFGLIFLILSLGAAWADNSCTGVKVQIYKTGVNSFTYGVTINPNATFTGLGLTNTPILAVDGLNVYQNNGSPGVRASSYKSLRTSWQVSTLPINRAVVFDSSVATADLKPGQSAIIGSALYAAAPDNMTFRVQIKVKSGNTTLMTDCYAPGSVVPEPASMTLLGMGLVPLAGFLRRRRS